jgi:ubiquinone/menaquinone biosynthesis C-methylase UbiE
MSPSNTPSDGVNRPARQGPPWQPFDGAAAAYDEWYESPLGAFADRVERRAVFDLLAPQTGELILDVGSGTGRYALELLGRRARAVGVEPSAGMLAVAQERRSPAGGPFYVRAAGEALPFHPGTFDGVIIVTTLEFAADPDALLLEAVRVTRSGGRVVVGALSPRGPWAARRRSSRSPLWAGARFFTEGQLRAMLGRYGPVRSWRALFVPPGLPWAPSPLLMLLEGLGAVLARRWAAFIAVRVDVGGEPWSPVSFPSTPCASLG